MDPHRLINAYRLGPVTIRQPQSGYRNTSYPLELGDGQCLNLIVYKAEPGILARITAANFASNAVASTGLPARQTQGRILKLTPHTPDPLGLPRLARYACLYDYLPGSTIPWEAYTMDHIKLLGLAMSRLHTALAAVPTAPNIPSVAAENQVLLKRMRRYFAQDGVTSSLRHKLALSLSPGALTAANAAIILAAQLPNHQLLHMDFVRGNILFGSAAEYPQAPLHYNDLAITGIIDFEKTALGPRVFDIARTLAFLLVDCQTKTPSQVAKYFLHSGYNKRGTMPFEPPIVTVRGRRVDLLKQLINFYLLHDFYKFLRHNPYEFLPQNQHFTRTRDLLLNRGLLLQ